MSLRYRCAEQHRNDAAKELRAELEAFCHDGLVQLAQDLSDARVVRGSWAGCVASYRGGRPGSVRVDRNGCPNNPFTRSWDAGWITDEEVLVAVRAELDRRRAALDSRPSRPNRAAPLVPLY
jgi:hypothetical protein